MPTAPTPTSARFTRRPVATSNSGPVSTSPPASVTVNAAVARELILLAATPVRTPMPSAPKTFASSSPASGSSSGTSRPSASTTVTFAPNLREHLRKLHPDRAAAQHDQR